MLKAIIIDDEEKSRKLLRNLLQTYCKQVEVVALADSVASGARAIRKHAPDLLFLDIVMPNRDGFELLDEIGDYPCEIIFTTAYDRYAIRAIRVCALDYLLKPIDVEELQAAVERARLKVAEASTVGYGNSRLRALIENFKALDSQSQKIGFPTASGVKFHAINQILFCKAEGNYTTIYLQGKQKLELVAKTLKEFEELLTEYNFMRTHRSYLVNLNHVTEYRRFGAVNKTDGEGGCVVVANSVQVPVSRDKRKLLLEKFSSPF